MRYKVRDKVVIKGKKDLEDSVSLGKYAHQICTIVDIYNDLYKVEFKEGDYNYILEERIDHEATAKLKDKCYISTDSIGVALSTNAISSAKLSISNIGNTLQQFAEKIAYSKGGETMNANEILEKWKNKRICEIETEYRNKKDQLTKEDEIAKLIEKHISQMNKTIKEKYDGVEKAVQVAVIRTPETDEKINLAEEEMSNKKLNIRLKVDEIKAVLEVAENQDKVFEILKKQGIIDNNYNIL